MTVIENENIIHVDIDDTLILHIYPTDDITEYQRKMSTAEDFINPYTGEVFKANRSKKHIDLIKNYKARGFFVIAHSGNGWKYTKSFIGQLELQDYIDLVHTKNTRYIDDLPCQEWMGNRIYLEYE